MRTTLTLDDDVAAGLRRVQKRRNLPFRAVVNEVIREGLTQMAKPPAARPRFETPVLDLGQPLIGNIDNIGEVLDIIEGEWHK
jgi:hypothetical protein